MIAPTYRVSSQPMQMAGGLLGSLICGQLSDIFGRRKILIGIYALFIVSSLCSAFANSWMLYMALKMIVGAAMSGELYNSSPTCIHYINFA